MGDWRTLTDDELHCVLINRGWTSNTSAGLVVERHMERSVRELDWELGPDGRHPLGTNKWDEDVLGRAAGDQETQP